MTTRASKIMPLATAVERFVRPNALLHLGYGGGRPNAAVAEVIRQFAGASPSFQVSAHGFVNTQHALVEAGLVDRLIVAYAGENFPSPRPNAALQRAIRAGSVTVENWSLWTLTARLIAGAMGLPFFPVRSLVGSSMAEQNVLHGFDEVALRSTGATSAVVHPLRPDVVLVQALAADEAGSVILAPPYGEGAWGALAAKVGAIACVERIVEGDLVRAHNTMPMIPAHAVRAVCHVPFGSHPYGIYSPDPSIADGHAEDPDFMAQVRTAAKNPQDFADWITRWITGLADHDSYLQRLGRSRLTALGSRADARVRAESAVEPVDADSAPPATDERMVLAAARLLRERIVCSGHQVVLAGIGQAHLAAWTAVTGLQDQGHDVQLAAELGMSGYVPRSGDPYLFASQNMPTCRQLTDVLDVLGRDIAGPGTSSIGVLGAGQVDRHGNINSTRTASGDYIVGSGGGNDVASAADEVVVVVDHSPGRLVDEVPYVTAPGCNVSVIVTSAGVLERQGGRLVLTRLLPGVDGENRAETLARIRRDTGWELPVAADCPDEPEPATADLARLRGYDPEHVFSGRRRHDAPFIRRTPAMEQPPRGGPMT